MSQQFVLYEASLKTGIYPAPKMPIMVRNLKKFCTVRTPFYARLLLLLPFHILYSGLTLSLFSAFCDTHVFVFFLPSFLPLLLLCFLSSFFITFLFLCLITSYCVLLLFLSFGLVSGKNFLEYTDSPVFAVCMLQLKYRWGILLQ